MGRLYLGLVGRKDYGLDQYVAAYADALGDTGLVANTVITVDVVGNLGEGLERLVRKTSGPKATEDTPVDLKEELRGKKVVKCEVIKEEDTRAMVAKFNGRAGWGMAATVYQES